LDLVAPAAIRFTADGFGEFGLIVVRGFMDCRYGDHKRLPAVEFSWEGDDEGDACCGRGWAVLQIDGVLRGRLFFHQGDDSGFTAERPRVKRRLRRVGGRRRPAVR
jgi:hypothetical protein